MSAQQNILQFIRRFPVLSLLLLCSLVGYVLATHFYPQPLWLVFGGLDNGHYWRLVTPIFAHFGLMHLVFNGLWLVLLGQRIELLEGSGHLLLVVLLSGFLSNAGQAGWSGAVNFGGMSGVVYALLGYCWIRHRFAPHPLLQLPKELIGFMLVWLLLGMTGIPTLLLGVGIANAAHLVGLLAGMALGMVFGLASSLRRQ